MTTFSQSEFHAVEDFHGLHTPPHSIASETSVLGGLLLENLSLDLIADTLSESDFYRVEHQLIFSAISALINSAKPADVVTVYEHLKSLGKAEDAGELSYLNSLAQYVPSASNIRRYAEIVRERAILRKMVQSGEAISASGYNTQGLPPPVPI